MPASNRRPATELTSPQDDKSFRLLLTALRPGLTTRRLSLTSLPPGQTTPYPCLAPRTCVPIPCPQLDHFRHDSSFRSALTPGCKSTHVILAATGQHLHMPFPGILYPAGNTQSVRNLFCAGPVIHTLHFTFDQQMNRGHRPVLNPFKPTKIRQLTNGPVQKTHTLKRYSGCTKNGQ